MTVPFYAGVSVNGAPVAVRDATISGTLTVGTGKPSVRVNRRATIKRVSLYVETAPTGAAIIVDVNIDGVTIFTNQANRPQIAAGANQGFTTTIDLPIIDPGELLRIDIDQVGSSVAGADLWVGVEYE